MYNWDFNNTTKEYPFHKTIHQLFEEQAERTPDNTALVFGKSSISYKELNEWANRLARVLIDRGVRVNDNVALITERSFAMIAGMLAILKSGAAYIPVDPGYPSARKEYILRNSGVSAVLTDNNCAVDFFNLININTADSGSYSGENLLINKDSRDLAYIIYTSGSTGLPKGVMIEHHSVINLISWVNNCFKVNETDTLLFVTSICFDLSVYDIFGILSAGGKVVIAGKEQAQNPSELKRLLLEEKITFWDSVPTTLNYLINRLEEDSSGFRQESLRLAFLSGDWIPVNLPGRAGKYFPNMELVSLGGATEGTVWSIYYRIKEVNNNWRSIPYGRPLDNNYFYILDDNMNPVHQGEAGELYIGGAGVARGYVNDTLRTMQSFVKNPFLGKRHLQYESEMMYKTGDLGRLMPDGNIEFLGRKDHQVKIRGFRVEIGEVENRLQSFKGVREAVVADRTDTAGNKYLCAYIVPAGFVGIQSLKAYLAEMLPDYMIPSMFIMLESLPLNSNGKVDRNALPEPCMATISTGVDYVPPSNELEQKLEEVWEKVLAIHGIGINHNFYDIGGSSVLAVALAAEMEKRNIPLRLQDIVNHCTIREQAALLSGAQDNTAAVHTGRSIEVCTPNTADSLVLEPMLPFTDIFYKNCFYNSLFPVISHFGRGIQPFLVNNTGVYTYDESCGQIKLDSKYISEKNYLEVMDSMGITSVAGHVGSDLIDSIMGSISRGSPVILWIDCFYEPFRIDTYKKQHWPHTLLIFGFNRSSRTFNIIEHGHKDGLAYKKRTISFEAITECHMGYLQYFGDITFEGSAAPVYMEFSSVGKASQDCCDYTQILIENNKRQADSIEKGLSGLCRFSADYESIIDGGRDVLLPCVKELISVFNRVIDNRKVEWYRISKIIGGNSPIAGLLNRVTGLWGEIRSDLIKFSVNRIFEPDIFKAHVNKIQEIYREERNYQHMFNNK